MIMELSTGWLFTVIKILKFLDIVYYWSVLRRKFVATKDNKFKYPMSRKNLRWLQFILASFVANFEL